MGETLQSIRKAQRLSISRLAEISLVSIRTIQRIEADDIEGLQRNTLRLLALALAVPEEEIAGERLSVTSLTDLVARFTAALEQRGGTAPGAPSALGLAAAEPGRDQPDQPEWVKGAPRKGAGKLKKITKHAEPPAVPARKRGGSGPKPAGPRKAG